jgi:3-methylfumaryl-CoA hydratase
MLDLGDATLCEGDRLPKGWHFILMGADTQRSQLRHDGFPGLGVPMPDLGLPRLLAGGRSVEYRDDIPIGAKVTRTSAMKSLVQKTNASGPIAIATIAHELTLAGASKAAIVETQTYILLTGQSRFAPPTESTQPVVAAKTKIVCPDETLLFQYSALGFNSHKIHIDKVYAREVEGFPDLVVNGGLTTLLLTEYARNDLKLNLRHITMKNVAPLFCGRPMILSADLYGERWCLKAHDETGKIAAKMEAEVNEL